MNKLLFACILLFAVIFGSASLFLLAAPQEADVPWITADSYYFDGKRQQSLRLLPDQMVLFFEPRLKEQDFLQKKREISAALPGVVVTEMDEGIAWIKIPEGANASFVANVLTRRFRVIASPVFYPQNALTGELVVRFKDEADSAFLSTFEARYKVRYMKSFSFSPRSFLFKAPSAAESLLIANRIHESGEVEYAYPNFLRKLQVRE